ncbi:MAG: hypothetical protein K6A90_13790 [Lachnospiraceae bacterium]|nr:hypothetical protein [Lachnospiraceae bacterium]
MLKITDLKLHNWYYPVVLLSYVLALFFSVVRPGVVSAVLVSLVVIETLIGLHNSRIWIREALHKIERDVDDSLHNVKTEDIILSLWLIYNILSGIWCIGFGMPASVYFGELFTTALPMSFYFCGRTDCSSRRFSLYFLLSVAIIGILGIILFITGPVFYLDYLYDLQLISKADIPTMRVRMHSVIGSTLMGFLPSIGMLVSVRAYIDSEGKGKKILSVFSFVFMLLLAFMSNQRSAMAAAIFILVYLNFLCFFTFRLFPKKYLIAECIAAVAVTAGFFMCFNGAFMKVYYRLISLPGSIAQRSDQWVGAANNMKNIWLGNGLGANGHRAIGFTEHLIADGGLSKLYVENGIIGTSLFVFLILLILKKGFKNLKNTAPEIGIIIVTLIMSIGSNMMSFALSVPVFYYYMGRAVRERESI